MSLCGVYCDSATEKTGLRPPDARDKQGISPLDGKNIVDRILLGKSA